MSKHAYARVPTSDRVSFTIPRRATEHSAWLVATAATTAAAAAAAAAPAPHRATKGPTAATATGGKPSAFTIVSVEDTAAVPPPRRAWTADENENARALRTEASESIRAVCIYLIPALVCGVMLLVTVLLLLLHVM